jgi:hypothetical protein
MVPDDLDMQVCLVNREDTESFTHFEMNDVKLCRVVKTKMQAGWKKVTHSLSVTYRGCNSAICALKTLLKSNAHRNICFFRKTS